MTVPTNIGEWRDKDVLIDADEKLGKLADIYYDAESDEPVFLAVRTGMLSQKQVLVPARDLVTSPDHITLPWTKADIDGAPTTRSGEELPVEDEERAFRHFGLDYTPPASTSGRRLVRR
ncbi:PRC-barrel domain-containing protein [Microlunatus sp. Gsoil 973]|jgi:hypothetical protein|uniref:PRC-barrel domain-containing protein n=1 Tax=Microlunatus sp. Gsoil 973 TaxID=2672569 RepID=UPI0018A818B4|nr:PRC-barrel domain-containing protein [Microlunatus sp. Gsoil 973]